MPMDTENFEASDEPVEVDRRARAGVVVSIRLSAEEADRLQELAAERSTTLSRLGREAIVRLLGAGAEESGVRHRFALTWTVMSTFPNYLQLVSEPEDPIVGTGGNAAARNAPAASSD